MLRALVADEAGAAVGVDGARRAAGAAVAGAFAFAAGSFAFAASSFAFAAFALAAFAFAFAGVDGTAKRDRQVGDGAGLEGDARVAREGEVRRRGVVVPAGRVRGVARDGLAVEEHEQ